LSINGRIRLPSGHNAQEEFLLGRIGASSFLRDRIRTRLTQAFGRCTRGPTDYAAIILIGSPLVDFCIQKEVRSNMHPELQAELDYGLNMSGDANPDDWKELLLAFLKQEKDWRDADDWIKRQRDRVVRSGDKAAEQYAAIVSDEVAYLYNMWKGDYNEALARAKKISDALAGNEVAGYRAWWYYLAGSAAWLSNQTVKNTSHLEIAKDMFARAAACPTAVSWFSALMRMGIFDNLIPEDDYLANSAVENVEEFVARIGFNGPKFERAATEFTKLIDQNGYIQFTQGLEQLGNFLGYTSWRPGTSGSPDCIWKLSDKLCIALEAKSEETAEDAIPLRDARESRGHLDWVASNVNLTTDSETIVLLVSPRSKIAKDALPFTERVYLIGLDEARDLSRRAISVVRGARAQSTDGAEEVLRASIQSQLFEAHLDPKHLLNELRKTPLNILPQR